MKTRGILLSEHWAEPQFAETQFAETLEVVRHQLLRAEKLSRLSIEDMHVPPQPSPPQERHARLSTVRPRRAWPARPRAETGGMDTAQHPLSLNHPGETLALVAHIFGFLPEESLVVIGLDGGITCGHLRIDLPAGAGSAPPEHLEDFAGSIADCLFGQEEEPSPGAALVLILAPEPAMPGRRPYAGLLAALRSAFRAARGTEVVQTWYAGGGHIRDYDCQEETCCPYPGLAVGEELSRVLTAHPMFAGRDDVLGNDGALAHGGAPALGAPADILAWFETPPFSVGAAHRPGGAAAVPSAAEIAQVEAAVETHVRRFGELSQEGGRPPYLCVAAWDVALSRAEAEGSAEWLLESPEQIAAMLVAVVDTGLRDTLIPMAAVDFGTAIYGYLAFCAGRRTGLEPEQAAQLIGGGGQASPEDLPARVEDYERSFLGQTGRTPAWERIDALETVLRAVHPFAGAEARSHILSLMGWVEWARGRGSVAGAYIDRCLEQSPENQLAQLIGRYMDVGGICPWAKVRRHSWSWNNRRWANTARKFLPPGWE